MEMKRTERGFSHAEFEDRYGQQCSIQKSSLAFEDCIWLGVDKRLADKSGDPLVDVNDRMHLTQDMVRELLPLLEHFVETGKLP